MRSAVYPAGFEDIRQDSRIRCRARSVFSATCWILSPRENISKALAFASLDFRGCACGSALTGKPRVVQKDAVLPRRSAGPDSAAFRSPTPRLLRSLNSDPGRLLSYVAQRRSSKTTTRGTPRRRRCPAASLRGLERLEYRTPSHPFFGGAALPHLRFSAAASLHGPSSTAHNGRRDVHRVLQYWPIFSGSVPLEQAAIDELVETFAQGLADPSFFHQP